MQLCCIRKIVLIRSITAWRETDFLNLTTMVDVEADRRESRHETAGSVPTVHVLWIVSINLAHSIVT